MATPIDELSVVHPRRREGTANDDAAGVYESRDADGDRTQQLQTLLGGFSIGLGMLELFAPRSAGKLIGVGNHDTLIRLCGLREVATGVCMLSGYAPVASVAARVAGDALDLSLLGAALRSPDAQPKRIAAAATAVLSVTAVDVYATQQQRHLNPEDRADHPVQASAAVVIDCTPQNICRFWRELENLPRFMTSLESVTVIDERTSEWVARPVAHMRVKWVSELVEDVAGERLSWQTLPDSEITHRGTVRFEPVDVGRGTIVHVDMEYELPFGQIGAAVAKLLGTQPDVRLRCELLSLKQLLESGEIATTRGQSSGQRSVLGGALMSSTEAGQWQ